MRKPVYDVYQMKPDRLPAGTNAAWLRTHLGEQPTDDWIFIGLERYPSRWTVAEMEEKGVCYRIIPDWLRSDRSASSGMERRAVLSVWLQKIGNGAHSWNVAALIIQ